jgi:type I restriction-modification system DNA methylase subunit/restriction endonuclease S subunit
MSKQLSSKKSGSKSSAKVDSPKLSTSTEIKKISTGKTKATTKTEEPKKTNSLKKINTSTKTKTKTKTKTENIRIENSSNTLTLLYNKLKDMLRVTSGEHITGKNATIAISHIITIYLLEECGRIEHFGLSDKIKFSTIYENVKKSRGKDANKYKDKVNKGFNEIFDELKENEYTKNAFISDPPYKIYTTFEMLVKEIHDYFEPYKVNSKIKELKDSYDLLGSEYETLLRTQLIGRDDGQYFTNRDAVKLIVDCVNPQFGQKVYDCCCGTGGFIVFSHIHMRNNLKKIIAQEKNNKLSDDKLENILVNDPRYEKLSNETFYGNDIDQDIKELLHANLILHDIRNSDDFTTSNTITHKKLYDKYDVVLSNYPFGTKGGNFFDYPKNSIEYKELIKYYGCESKKLPLLMLAHTINILKKGGKAGVIVTTGELSNSGKDYKLARKNLIENNTLTKIIILPKGIFSNAMGVSTAVLCFTKGGKTKDVEFNGVPNTKCDKMVLIKKVSYQKIIDSDYFLDIQVYNQEEVFFGDIPMVKLSELCEFKNGKTLKKDDINEGIYPVIGGGKKPYAFHNEYNRDPQTILVSSSGSAGYVSRYDCPVWASDCFSVNVVKETLDKNYLYYMLLQYQEKIYKLKKGTAQPHVYSKDLALMKIPLPTISVQKQMSKLFDSQYEIIRNAERMLELQKESNVIFMEQLINQTTHKIKTLGEVLQVESGEYIKKDQMLPGNYLIYGGGDSNGSINKFNREKKLVIAKDGVSAECVRFINKKFFLNHHGWTFVLKTKNLIENYVNYYLQNIQEKIYGLAKGTAQKGINQNNFYNLTIPIPSIDDQEEIIKKMDQKKKFMELLEDEIKISLNNIKFIMKKFLETPDDRTTKKSKKAKVDDQYNEELDEESSENSDEESSENSDEESSENSDEESSEKSDEESSEKSDEESSEKSDEESGEELEEESYNKL